MLQKQKPQCPNEDLKWLEKSNMKLYQKCNASYYLAIDGGVTRYIYTKEGTLDFHTDYCGTEDNKMRKQEAQTDPPSPKRAHGRPDVDWSSLPTLTTLTKPLAGSLPNPLWPPLPHRMHSASNEYLWRWNALAWTAAGTTQDIAGKWLPTQTSDAVPILLGGSSRGT